MFQLVLNLANYTASHSPPYPNGGWGVWYVSFPEAKALNNSIYNKPTL